MSLKDSGSDLSHRPKRRRFHESYNFNMKCPTPGCNSLGECPSFMTVIQGFHCDQAFQTLQWLYTQSSHRWKLFLAYCLCIISDVGKYDYDELFTACFSQWKSPSFPQQKQKWETSSLERPPHVARGLCFWGLMQCKAVPNNGCTATADTETMRTFAWDLTFMTKSF